MGTIFGKDGRGQPGDNRFSGADIPLKKSVHRMGDIKVQVDLIKTLFWAEVNSKGREFDNLLNSFLG